MSLGGMLRASAPSPSPSWVVLQLIEDCNLRCAMCYEWGETGAYRDHGRLAALDLEVALRVIAECSPAKPRFELFGGEPLLYPGIWDVMTAIREAGCQLAFPTNGTLVEQHAERLVDHQPNRVWISLDGPEAVNDAQRGHGVFKRAMHGLRALVAAKRRRGSRLPEIGIACVVSPANHLRIGELFLSEGSESSDAGLDLAEISAVSLELQSWATEEQHRQYARLLREEFGVPAAPYARAYVRDKSLFGAMDRAALARQIQSVREACTARGISLLQPAEGDRRREPRPLPARRVGRT